MKTKNLYIEDIGEIKLSKSGRAKHLNISIKPFEGVNVSVPNYVSFKKAEEVVRARANWIKKHLKRMSASEDKRTFFDENTKFKTRKHELKITADKRDNISVVVSNKYINVKYPEDKKISDKIIQTEIRKGIARALRKEAKEYLPGRVSELARKHGFVYRQVFLKNLKTRWGSCSSMRNINLNIQLMRLSDELIDYTILHELAHTVEQNHGKMFWALLDNIVGDAKAIRKKLNNCTTQIF